MCFGKGGLFGSIGSLLGTVAADVLFPEIGIPATIAGSFLGGTAGGLIGGESPLQALEGGAISGATAGLGSALLGSVGGLSGIGDALGIGGSSGGIGAANAVDQTLATAGAGPSAADITSATTGSTAAGGPAVAGVSGLESATAPTTAGFGAGSSGSSTLSPPTDLTGAGGDFFNPATSGIGSSNLPSTLGQTIGSTTPTAGSSLPDTIGIGGGSNAAGPNATLSASTGGSPMDNGGGGTDFGGGGGSASGGNWLQRLFGTGGNTPITPEVFSDPVGGGSYFGGGPTGSGGGGIGNSILGYLGNNPGLLLGGGLIGYEALTNQGINNYPQAKTLGADAATFDQLGHTGINALQTGQIPPGAQALLDQAKSASKANVRSTYARMGLTGSTSEAQAMSQIDQNIEGRKWDIINNLVQTGTSALGQGASINQNLLNTQISQDKALQDAIARFAASLAGGGLKAAA